VAITMWKDPGSGLFTLSAFVKKRLLITSLPETIYSATRHAASYVVKTLKAVSAPYVI
jgi:hypothetical protein